MNGLTNSDGHVTAQIMVLSAIYSCPVEYCESIARRVEEVVPAMQPGVDYTLRMLCGDDFWAQLTDGECRKAGRCMARLTASGRLPLCVAESRHEYPKYYRLK
jgi:hypothetical protein